MGRGSSSSSPPAAPTLLLLLLLLIVCFSHGAAAARLLQPPLQPAAVVVSPQVPHQAKIGTPAADGLVFQEGEAAGNGDDLFISEMMGAEAAAAVCHGEKDECLERRLLGDAHLDYIYTQHKGKAP